MSRSPETTGITTSTTAATLAVFGYGYDAAGQLTSGSITDPSSSSASTHGYGYDSIGQLTTVNDGTITSSYGATSAGAITSTTPGNALAYNSAQQLTSLTPPSGPVVSYVYDANGARTSSTVAGTETTEPSSTSYGYSPTGSLASVTLPATVTAPAATITYTSDGDGLRESRTAGGATDNFLWATGGSLPLLLDDGHYSYLYGPSSAPIAQVADSNGTVRYLHSDLIGSTRVVTSSGGSVVGTTRYDEYGNAVSSGTNSAIGYSGNWTDPDTGLVYLRARDYDPRTAQFTAVDAAVDTTRQPYAYVANDPLLLTDPTGLDFWGDAGRNALAFGAGVLDGATFGVSSAILGAVVPGYNCLIKDNAFFTAGSIAGTIVSSIAITAITAGAGGGLAIAGIAGRLAIKEAVSVAASAAKRLITTGIEKAAARLGEEGGAIAAKGATESRVFWSGGDVAKNAAEIFAKANSGTTLEMTAQGRALEQQTAKMAWADAKPLWDEASKDFAQGARGDVHVFQSAEGVSLESIWAKIEYRALQENGVNIIYHTVWGP